MSMQADLTRRQLLRRAGVAAGGLAVAGGVAEALIAALASPPAHAPKPPSAPRWRSRPDLQIPALTVARLTDGTHPDPIFIAPYNAPRGQAGAVIVDNRGQPIWENPLAGKVTANFRMQRYRASPVLTWWEGSIELGHGVGEYVIADSRYRTIRRIQAVRGLRGDLHEFVITPRDTALLTTYAIADANLSDLGGSRTGSIQDAIFQEIDLASGRLLLEWHSLEHIALAESYAPVSADWDYFHINSVDLDRDGNYLVSSRSTHTVYKLDRNGSVLWRLGGKHSDFQMGPGTRFAWQHHVRRQPDGTVTVFDNGATPAVEPRSRGLILDVDEQAMTARLRHQYANADILAGSQGSVQLLSNGNVFVGWGEAPRVSEFDREGRLLFDALLGHQYQSYRAFRLPWTGRPAETPALALAAEGDSVTAYASWNGATEVAAWRLLAGANRRAMRVAATCPTMGFETVLPAPARARHFVAEAIDARGTPLGRSRTATLS
jgi:hypothetical protein